MIFFKIKLTIILFILCNPIYAQEQLEKESNLVESLSEAYRSAVLAEDTAALVNMLHPDVMFHPPTGLLLAGKDTVSKLIISFLDQNDVTEWSVSIDRTVYNGNCLLEFGHFKIVENGEAASERKYINIWHEHKGEYKLIFRGWSPL